MIQDSTANLSTITSVVACSSILVLVMATNAFSSDSERACTMIGHDPEKNKATQLLPIELGKHFI